MQETTYTIQQITQFTGLTDRTVRKYLSAGILQGQMDGGAWHFTLEAVDAFMSHPSVRPSIAARKNAMIYDFLADDKKPAEKACLVLDCPNQDKQTLSAFFCDAVNSGGYQNLRFSFDAQRNAAPRVVLTGSPTDVLDLLTKYNSRK